MVIMVQITSYVNNALINVPFAKIKTYVFNVKQDFIYSKINVWNLVQINHIPIPFKKYVLINVPQQHLFTKINAYFNVQMNIYMI